MIQGKAHLIDGSIVDIISSENESLWNYGKRNINKVLVHNDNGPAVIWNTGSKWFCKKGIIHREDGPAAIIVYRLSTYTYIRFFLNEKEYSCNIFALKTNHLICKICEKFCKQSCF